MKKQDGRIIYSPTDIVRFMESPFASWMERAALEDKALAELKNKPDPLLQTLAKKGFAHERDYADQLKKEGHEVLEIPSTKPKTEIQETIEAIKAGKEIIFQAHLSLDNFAGYTDFLCKVEGESLLGNYHYQVWDTKLAKRLKPKFITQLCCYGEMLSAIQGVLPEYISVVFGDRKQGTVRVSDYFFYYQALKQEFLKQQKDFNPTQIPNPADSRNFGDWSDYADKLLKEKDHLSQIYDIRRATIKNLERAGISTMAEMAKTKETRIKKISNMAFPNLKIQAQLQKSAKKNKPPPFHLLPHNSKEPQGLHCLPPSSLGDVFFDIEGNPFTGEGLEYLWGFVYDKNKFDHIWAHDQEQEKQALTDFITWVYSRWQADPSIHIYHYGTYEVNTLRQLMRRYGICENEIDNLLRHNVFVDLFSILRNSLLIGEPSYSLKNIEKLYRKDRKTEVIGGGDSIVAYENWLESKDNTILEDILAYNKDDCFSTQELSMWLHKQQKQRNISYIKYKNEEEEEDEEEIEVIKLRDDLLVKAEKTRDESHKRMIEILAWVLQFHRRENKSVWWRYFDRCKMSDIDLEDDMDCLIGIQKKDESNNIYYLNEEQPFKNSARTFHSLQKARANLTEASLSEGIDMLDSFYKKRSFPPEIKLLNYDPNENSLLFKHAHELPEKTSLIPFEYIPPKPITTAIKNVAEYCIASNFSSSAITDFLMRKPSRIHNHTGKIIVKNRDEVINLASNLNNSYLCIQGPPGSGKTFTAIRIIEKLLEQKKRVGITSNSHKAIENLLEGVAQKTNDGHFVKIGRRKKEFEETFEEVRPDGSLEYEGLNKNIKYYERASKFNNFGPALCLGGTAWAFCNAGFAGQFDYLFVDEAGQVSLANLIGMSQAAKNIILMGDQMQLSQPIQGSHPGESGKSTFEYLLQDLPTIPPELGVFLPNTYRMHPDVCSFISEMVYDGKLQSTIPSSRHIEVSSKLIEKQAGVCFVPIEHEGNTQASEEEVEIIKRLADDLLGSQYIDGRPNKPNRQLDWNDILFVAPYNFQVNQLKRALGEEARVGTVDLFQGQEAPVVILSMCTSDATESPRGIDFIFSKNRLNVAISRAECLTIVVGNPNLATTYATTPKQMNQINMFSHITRSTS